MEALAWAIIVESALLNARLMDDMQRTAMSKGCPGCVCPVGAMYLPQPCPEDRLAFMEYVRCRWPIHIFAVDPVTQDQNIAEEYSRRRELQLTLSLAFVSGQINASNFTKFTRQLDYDLATVTLNRTAAGFSHGDDTFGWRFYPRLQPPRPKGNLQTFGQTLFGGPHPDCDVLDRAIEPGIRECVAIIIMPSFVPYAIFDVHSNWFRLNQRDGWLPTRHDSEMSTVDMVRLSRSVHSMHELATTICDAQMYRDGEVARLLSRVHQLDRELPLQTMQGLVPIENTLGGFELFNTGVTDLAPELAGWYGAPGIFVSKPDPGRACVESGTPPAAPPQPAQGQNPAPQQQGQQQTQQSGQQSPTPGNAQNGNGGTYESPPNCPCAGTTVFLVGKHFSVHDTKVIAGGRCIPHFTLLSREVMRVTIPTDVNIDLVERARGPSNAEKDFAVEEYVDVHIATPYGVTGHLHIPVYKAPKKDDKNDTAASGGASWKTDEWTAQVKFADKCKASHVTAIDSLPDLENKWKLPFTTKTSLNPGSDKVIVRFTKKLIGNRLEPLSQITDDEPLSISGSGKKDEYLAAFCDTFADTVNRVLICADISGTDTIDALVGESYLITGGNRVAFAKPLLIKLQRVPCYSTAPVAAATPTGQGSRITRLPPTGQMPAYDNPVRR